MTTLRTTTQDLGKQIEQLVHAHLVAVRRTAMEAVEQAIGHPRVKPLGKSREVKRPSCRKAPCRSPDELSVLGETFYETVCAHPGESMATLTVHMGVAANTLRSVVRRLKGEGRLRTAGQRQHTRYFPRVPMSNPSA